MCVCVRVRLRWGRVRLCLSGSDSVFVLAVPHISGGLYGFLNLRLHIRQSPRLLLTPYQWLCQLVSVRLPVSSSVCPSLCLLYTVFAFLRVHV